MEPCFHDRKGLLGSPMKWLPLRQVVLLTFLMLLPFLCLEAGSLPTTKELGSRMASIEETYLESRQALMVDISFLEKLEALSKDLFHTLISGLKSDSQEGIANFEFFLDHAGSKPAPGIAAFDSVTKNLIDVLTLDLAACRKARKPAVTLRKIEKYLSDTKALSQLISRKYSEFMKTFSGLGSELREGLIKSRKVVFAGFPKVVRKDSNLKILENKGFFSGFSGTRKSPLWVGYCVFDLLFAEKFPRPSSFSTDDRVDSQVESDSFKNSGYDKGHLAPNWAISTQYGKEAQRKTFLMSNICPQKPTLNRVIWRKLEALEMDYARKFSRIWVITGPVFDEHREVLPGNIEIPDAFFKCIVRKEGEEPRIISFLIPQNVCGNEDLKQFLVPIDRIEESAGMDLFWQLPDPLEESLEAAIPTGIW